MDYQHLFMTKYYFFIGIFCVFIALLVAWIIISKIYNDMPKLTVLDKIIYLILVGIYFFFITIPFIKDKAFIDSKTYIQADGVVCANVNDGYKRYISTICIKVNGKKNDFHIAYIDDDIYEGDEVKVTYLPNTTYAVIEKKK